MRWWRDVETTGSLSILMAACLGGAFLVLLDGTLVEGMEDFFRFSEFIILPRVCFARDCHCCGGRGDQQQQPQSAVIVIQ